MEQQTHAKGPYREVLDWFVAQIDRLDDHARQIDANADRLTAEELDAQRRAIVQAHEWLADQLADALHKRGMAIAA